MGGSTYLIPAPYTGLSSRDAHLRRNPPSGEPGTDYYMPTGTPLGAPTRCRVVDIGGSIYPATGRYVTVDDGVRWIRFLHLLEWRCSEGDELDPGEVFGISGASGYGSEYFGEPYRNNAFWWNTGGDHVHVTAFKGRGYTFGSTGTVDFHAMTGGSVASINSKPFPDDREEYPDMPIHWHTKDKPAGGGVADLWTIAFPDSRKIDQTRTQAVADRWARLYGNAREVTLDDLVYGVSQIVSLPQDTAVISDEQFAKLANMVTSPRIDEGAVKTLALAAIREAIG